MCLTFDMIPSTWVSDVSSSKTTHDETMTGSILSGVSPIKLMTTAENGPDAMLLHQKISPPNLGRLIASLP